MFVKKFIVFKDKMFKEKILFAAELLETFSRLNY